MGDFVTQADFSDVVIGISGGIDSAVVTALAADALGREHVHGILLPGKFSSTGSLTDAKQLCSNIGVEYFQISIEDACERIFDDYERAVGSSMSNLAIENTQARCRMIYIMALSNSYGWMMLNTGNKSEACLGYSTLYGDTSGAFAPIGGLYKTEVFALARYMNEIASEEGRIPPIPESTITKPPSAELSTGQTDEASLGMSYSKIDKILKLYVEDGMSIDDIEEAGISRDSIENVIGRYLSYDYKRAIEPPYPNVRFY